jgi:signal transduction histidine kinase/CheY-like chemotaxis protein
MECNAHEKRILILTPRGRDGNATAEVLTRAGFSTFVCETRACLVDELGKGAGAVCLAEEALTEGGYVSLREWVRAQPPWSDMPFVVLSSRQDEIEIRVWREKLTGALGHVSLLERPLQAITLASALRTAIRSRTKQYEVRDHIDLQARSTQKLEHLVAERTAALERTNRELVEQIAERARVEELLRHAQKMEAIGQLTGGLAHDFNNMLAVIMGGLNMLARRLKNSDPGIAKYVDMSIEGTQRAAQLTRRLLAFSRQQALCPKVVDANTMVLGMSELLRGTLGRDIVLEARTAPDVWPVFVDVGELENAILNIAFNARDAMPGGGKLTIETQNISLNDKGGHSDIPGGEYLLLTISDTGSGISPEIIGKVFDPFFTTKTVGKGTGLGLSQVYGFVKQSEGHFTINSAPSKGTSVKIYLSRSLSKGDLDEVGGTGSILLPGRNEFILVVDDEPGVRALAVDSLIEVGYRAMAAPDGRTALRFLEQHPDIDLLLTDIIMPDLNGRMLVDEAKKARPSLKVLYMTGFSRDAVHNDSIGAGINLIGKPFTIEELAKKVRLTLDGASDQT